MFVIDLTYIKPIQEVEQFFVNHIDFLVRHYASGDFICSGRKNPRVGGIIICKAPDIVEVEQIIEEDPFYYNKVAKYKIIEFLPTKYADGFERFIK